MTLTFDFGSYARVKPQHVLCFAYGSNMNIRQMMRRCPDAIPEFTATLDGYRLIFTGESPRWGGAVASIKADARGSVQGIVYRLTASDLERLDGFEGYPAVYERESVEVINHSTGDHEWCTTYVKADMGQEGDPSLAYLEAILQGYEWAGLRPSRRLRAAHERAVRQARLTHGGLS